MFIKSISSDPAGGTVLVVIANSAGTGEECLILSLGEWKRMLNSLGRAVAELDPIDEELYDALHLSAEKTAALREAARILSVGDKSARAIRQKLKTKGFSAEATEHAVTFLEKKGYLNEADACLRIAQAAVRSKHYGKHRIVEYLCSHGYDISVSKAAAQSIPEEDYREALVYQMQKKYPNAASLSRPEQQKIIAAMMRQGFSAAEVKKAITDSEK